MHKLSHHYCVCGGDWETSQENRNVFLRRYQGWRKKTIAIQDGGRVIHPAKPTCTHSYWKTNLHLLTLNKKRGIRVSRCRFGTKIIFPAKPTSTHTYWKKTIRVSRCRFGGINISTANFTSTCFYSDFHAKRVVAGKIVLQFPIRLISSLFPNILGNYVLPCGG